MRYKETSAKCEYCFNTFPSSSMGKHLQSCKERDAYFQSRVSNSLSKANSGRPDSRSVFLLKISSPFMPEYWLFAEANGTCRLLELDYFLRDMWLECCGHLSCFTINNQDYDSVVENDPVFDTDSKSMYYRLDKILKPGMVFDYQYDFGSTTELVINVLSARPGRVRQSDGPVRLAARNDTIYFQCKSCKKQEATDICTDCGSRYSLIGFTLCKNCLKSHKCGEEMALPIVNSPRTGVCGYTG